jgi:hypothetical protein
MLRVFNDTARYVDQVLPCSDFMQISATSAACSRVHDASLTRTGGTAASSYPSKCTAAVPCQGARALCASDRHAVQAEGVSA